MVCIRFEDSCSVSYTKTQLVEEVRRTKSGKTNTKRSFPDGPKKATAVFLDCLSQELQHQIKGTLTEKYDIHILQSQCHLKHLPYLLNLILIKLVSFLYIIHFW